MQDTQQKRIRFWRSAIRGSCTRRGLVCASICQSGCRTRWSSAMARGQRNWCVGGVRRVRTDFIRLLAISYRWHCLKIKLFPPIHSIRAIRDCERSERSRWHKIRTKKWLRRCLRIHEWWRMPRITRIDPSQNQSAFTEYLIVPVTGNRGDPTGGRVIVSSYFRRYPNLYHTFVVCMASQIAECEASSEALWLKPL